MIKKFISTALVASSLICSLGVSVGGANILPGDIDGDGSISSTDYLKIKNYLLDSSKATDQFKSLADANGDGNIDSTDYLFIKRLWISSEDSEVELPKLEKPDESLETSENTSPDESSASESAAPDESSVPDESSTTEEPSSQPESVEYGLRVYVPDYNNNDFNTYKTYFDGTVDGLFNQIINFGVLPEGIEVLSAKIGNSTVEIDLSKEFGTAITNARASEVLLMASVANTVIEYFSVKSVELTVEGEVLETGLSIYDSPIYFQTPISLYVPNENYSDFIVIDSFFDGTIDGLVDALVINKVLPKDSKVNSFSIKDNVAKIDLSEEFGKGVNEARTSELMIIGSLANTIIKYYNVEFIELTVEGEVLETGLALYDSPIPFQTLISIYVPNDEYTDFVAHNVFFNGTIDGLVDALVSFNALPEKSKVNSFSIKDNVAKIDLSEEFGKGVNEARTSELMIIGSLANTIIKYYNVEFVELTVEGEILETGLRIYDSPIAFQKLITLYVPNETKSGLDTVEGYFDGTVDGIIDVLVRKEALPENTKVYSFSIKEKAAIIDLSEEFGKGVSEAGNSENLIVGSLVNTLIRNYGLTSVQFTVEGKILETASTVYGYPIEFIV